MKYLSTLLFAMALIVSWQIIHEQVAISFETHAALQLKIVEVIKQSILEAKPTAEKIEITNISTEPLSDQTIKAYFSYKYSEPDTNTGERVEQLINGDAVLRRKNGPNFSEDNWVMEQVQTQTGNMTFKKGILITPGEDESKGNSQDGSDSIDGNGDIETNESLPTDTRDMSKQNGDE